MFSSVQFSRSVVSNSATPWTAAYKASLSISNSWSLLKLMCIESVMPSNLILCRPLLLLPSIFSNIRMFSKESVIRIRWPKYWSFSFSISTSNEYSGLISFRINWFDFLAVQGTLKSLLQHHSSKAPILCCSVFFIFCLSHPYMIKDLTAQTALPPFCCAAPAKASPHTASAGCMMTASPCATAVSTSSSPPRRPVSRSCLFCAACCFG